MKRFLAFLLALTAAASLAACSNGPRSENPTITNTTAPTTEVTQPSSEASEPSSEATDPSTEATEPSAEPTKPSAEPTEPSTEATAGTDSTEGTTQADIDAQRAKNHKTALIVIGVSLLVIIGIACVMSIPKKIT